MTSEDPRKRADDTFQTIPMKKNPEPLTDSNRKIQVKEGTLSQPCPKGENDLGWDMK
jgi:hypothetical protein